MHREGFEPPSSHSGEPGLRPGRFSRTHAPVQTWRKVDESNAHGSSPCPGFRDQLPAIQQYLPQVAESAGVEPASLLREPLFSRQVPYRPAHSPVIENCQRTTKEDLVGPVGFEPTRKLHLSQLRMPVPPRAWLLRFNLDRGSVAQSGSTES